MSGFTDIRSFHAGSATSAKDGAAVSDSRKGTRTHRRCARRSGSVDRLDHGLLFKRVKADVSGAGNAAVGAHGLGQVQHRDVHAMGQRLGDEFASDAAAAPATTMREPVFGPSQLSSCAIIISPWESHTFRG